MNRTAFARIASGAVGVAAACAIAVSITLAVAQPNYADDPPFQLPPGWTMEDMMACMEAGTPGKMHEYLAAGVGTWHGRNTMWMAPDVDPMTSEGVSTVSVIMNGRFTKVETTGNWPGLGPYNGMGIYGYDNVAGKFQAIWIEDHSTGMSVGTGELSPDGKTLTWSFTYSCPVTQKPATLRQVEHITGEDTRKLEMFTNCPKTGREFKMMEIELARKDSASGTGGAQSKAN